MTFFGYDWHGERFRRYLSHFSGVHRIAHMHGFIHGHIAADRAKHTFGLSERECEAIARHMFPLAAMPRTRIAWIVTVADKAVASKEMTAAVGGYVSHAYHQNFRMKKHPISCVCWRSGFLLFVDGVDDGFISSTDMSPLKPTS